MLDTLKAGNALEVATVLTERLPQTLSQTARELYRVLVHIGVEVTQRRGHAASTSEVVMHLPVELVAEACGISRVSLWRHLPALKELGLVDARTHKANCRGQVRSSGTVWRVRLSPLRGSRARVSGDDLRHRWRGSEMRGAASFRALKQTKELQTQSLKTEIAIQWALSPGTSQSPVNPCMIQPAQTRLEALLDVTGVGKAERAQAVDRAAQALSQALRDSSSLNFYRRLLWQLLRRFDATQEDYGYQLYLMAQRARTDTLEGFARRPGALFLSRLKRAIWFEQMMNLPPTRVGTEPLQS